ncbi:MAG: hypothetical protein N0E48_03050 [Candidatus Thiodiazotropha endolucinida]|nr:hypothetical protein [Candidatus Thiodiazotropha taylori]MCW4342340.1 hypothetical protein [Candidatus Thiodiazotropha endolucinida]
MKEKNTKLETKFTDLESRSMRDNLLFYGIPETQGDTEDCDYLVKQFCNEHLELHQAKDMLLDRVHRVGVKKPNRSRPVVAKFHYFRDRETVRLKSYNYTEAMKLKKVGVGVQQPQQIREARKPLYPVMQKAKENGKSVKFVKDKLYIDGVEYQQPQAQQHAS